MIARRTSSPAAPMRKRRRLSPRSTPISDVCDWVILLLFIAYIGLASCTDLFESEARSQVQPSTAPTLRNSPAGGRG